MKKISTLIIAVLVGGSTAALAQQSPPPGGTAAPPAKIIDRGSLKPGSATTKPGTASESAAEQNAPATRQSKVPGAETMVRVLAEGQPVAGATVRITTAGSPATPVQILTTDASGTAKANLKDGVYSVEAASSGYAPAKTALEVRGGIGSATVALRRGGERIPQTADVLGAKPPRPPQTPSPAVAAASLGAEQKPVQANAGAVIRVLAGNTPVAGAEVALSAARGNNPPAFIQNIATGNDGTARADVRDGVYVLDVSHPGYQRVTRKVALNAAKGETTISLDRVAADQSGSEAGQPPPPKNPPAPAILRGLPTNRPDPARTDWAGAAVSPTQRSTDQPTDRGISSRPLAVSPASAQRLESGNWDFESGLRQWTAEGGNAFRVQPTYGDVFTTAQLNPGLIPLGGDYWDVPYSSGRHLDHWICTGVSRPDARPAAQISAREIDRNVGTLRSITFPLDRERQYISFLIGGTGGHIELLIKLNPGEQPRRQISGRPDRYDPDSRVVNEPAVRIGDEDWYVKIRTEATATTPGQRSRELLRRAVWDTTEWAGHQACIRLVDDSAHGHLSVDDFIFSSTSPAPVIRPVQWLGAPLMRHRDRDAAPPLFGFADLHAHPMSFMAAGGHLVHGSPGGNYQTSDLASDLASCDGTRHGGGGTYAAAATLAVMEEKGWLTRWKNDLPASLGPAAAACVPFASGLAANLPMLATHNQFAILASFGGWATAAAVDPLTHVCLNAVASDALQHDRGGWPDFQGWPKWYSTAHQQMHITWIRRAYEGGLRLMSALVVHNDLLQNQLGPPGGGAALDRTMIENQVAAMRRLVAANSDWMEIALGPAEARRIIAANKLAIVLGAEVDHLGAIGFSTPEAEVDWLRSIGIRQLNPIHLANNSLGGCSIYEDMFSTLNNFLNRTSPEDPNAWFEVEDGGASRSERGAGIEFKLSAQQFRAADVFVPIVDFGTLQLGVPVERYTREQAMVGHKNRLGLTSKGETYIRSLIAKHMIIDVDHMSQKAMERTLAIAEEAHYPVISSHTTFREMKWRRGETGNEHKLPHESDKSPVAVQRIKALGGIVAAQTLPADFRDVGPVTGQPSRVANDAPGTVKSWAQSYLYAISRRGMDGGAVALGTDFDGFASEPGPRFGPAALPAAADDLPRARMLEAGARDAAGTRRAKADAQDAPVAYARADLQDYNGARWQDHGVYTAEEREAWQAIALAHSRDDIDHPAHDLRAFAFNLPVFANRIEWMKNVAKGIRATSESTLPDPGVINTTFEHDSAVVQRGAFYGKTGHLPDSYHANEGVRNTFNIVSRIFPVATRLARSRANIPLTRSVTGRHDFDVNLDGLAHYGMIPDFLQDAKNVGLTKDDLRPLFRSAEGYIEMWERCER